MDTQFDRKQGRATLQKVAEAAGVSPTTASLVLAGKARDRRISKDAHARVRKAAEELNYAPNLLVRSLRRGRTHIVSFYNAFRHRESGDLYRDRLATAVEYAGAVFGYDVLVHCNFQRTARETYQFLNGGLADGVLLFAPLLDDPLVPLLHKSSLPVVLLNARDPLHQLPSVVDDGTDGMRLVVEAMVANGHRRAGVFGGFGPDARDAQRRQRLFVAYGRELGLEVPDDCIFDSNPGYRESLRRLVAHPSRPTALFVWHDRFAYRVLDACGELGIQVPGDLSVVGYDGLRWPAGTSHTVCSVHVDLEAMARMGMQTLDQIIKGYDGPLIEENMPVALTTGTTLGPTPSL